MNFLKLSRLIISSALLLETALTIALVGNLALAATKAENMYLCQIVRLLKNIIKF